jgi:hypothetical protein
MFRFTIRDVLWLMVVVGMGLGWILTAGAESKRHQREQEKSHRRLLNTALEWAKEKGKPVLVNAGGHTIQAMPDGQYEFLSHAYPDHSN